MKFNEITVIADENLTNEEISQLVAEETALWEKQNKTLSRIELSLEGENVVVRSVEKSPIEFDLKFCLGDREITPDLLFEMGQIFAKDHYVSFQSCDYLGVEFFVIATSINLITFGNYAGWLEIKLRTSAPYAFSKELVPTIDCTKATSSSPITFKIDCKSNVQNAYGKYEYYPYLLIDMKNSNTSITLTNISYGGRKFGFTGLTANESIEVDNENKRIVSSTNQPRLNKLIENHNWFCLTYGVNYISCNASAVIQVKLRYPVYI
jgi:hypothetical protein